MLQNGAKYHRKGFGLKDLVQGDLSREYESELIAYIRQNNYRIEDGDTTIKLAEAFGFCWGVDRAVLMAYETRKQFPDKHIWITNEIIHNPLVNNKLRQMEIDFIPVSESNDKDLSQIKEGDVVILPAFGASVSEMQLLEAKRCEIVDTTCPWVSRVWNRVDKYTKSKFTALIHGKFRHEETIATSSRAEHYIIVEDLDEAQWVCNYILNGGSKEEFLKKFAGALSKDFDPDLHLQRLGVTNQTTMLKGETEQIGKLVEKTMLTKYGPTNLDNNFLSPGDTICDATQERQDAMKKLTDEPLDLVIVIGGYNSSNTGHLHEMAASQNIKAYHIESEDCIGMDNSVRYKLPHEATQVKTKDWLPARPLTIGITAGASTPDQVVARVIERVFELRAQERH